MRMTKIEKAASCTVLVEEEPSAKPKEEKQDDDDDDDDDFDLFGSDDEEEEDENKHKEVVDKYYEKKATSMYEIIWSCSASAHSCIARSVCFMKLSNVIKMHLGKIKVDLKIHHRPISVVQLNVPGFLSSIKDSIAHLVKFCPLFDTYSI